jgi:hypothetical protein
MATPQDADLIIKLYDLRRLRNLFGPHYLVNLERLIASHPHGEERVGRMRERFKVLADQRASREKG